MNGFRWTVACATVLCAGLARGETETDTPLLQPPSFQDGFTNFSSTPAPAAAPAVPACPSGCAQCGPAGADEGCAAGACAGGCRCGCNLGKPWKLPQPCCLQEHNIVVGGWLQQGITGNPQNPADGFNGPIATNDLADQYQLNQLWLFLYRPTKTDGCGWDAGGRVDVVYGTDWRFGTNYGLESRIDSNQSFYGLILPQFYGEVACDDISVRIGHFAPAFSYEQIPAPANFFYSHCYAMNGFSEPLLVTGVDVAWAVNDQLKIIGGFNRGWMQFEDVNESLDFLGGVKWVSEDKKTNISYMVTTGPQDPAGQQNTFVYALVVQRDLNEKWKYVIQNDIGVQEHGNLRNPADNAEWYDICQWLFYKINPCWQAGLRFEWFRDDDGGRLAGVGNVIGSDKGWLGAPGFAGNFYELTAGVNYRPHANFVFRPEIRYDWYNGTTNLANELPFNGGRDKDQLLLAVDMIFTY